MLEWNSPALLPPSAGNYERRDGEGGSVVVHHWNGSRWSHPRRKDWAGEFVPQSGLQWRAIRHFRDAVLRPPTGSPLVIPPTPESVRLMEVSAAFFSRPVP